MTVPLDEFKKRFGKKALDATTPQDLYKKRLQDYKAKITEVTTSKSPEATIAKVLILDSKRLADAGKYAQACDALFEMNAAFVLDVKRRKQLEADLTKARTDDQALPIPTTEGKKDYEAGLSAIAAERYDEAERLLGEIRKGVQLAISTAAAAKAAYEARSEQATHEVRRVFAWAATQGSLTAAQMELPTKMEGQMRIAAASAKNSKYVSADRQLDEVFKLGKQAAAVLPVEADKAWAARSASEKAVFQAAVDKVAGAKFPPSVTGPAASLKAKLGEAGQHGGAGRFKEALAALDEAGQAFAAVQQAAATERLNARRAIDANQRIFKLPSWPASTPKDLLARRSELEDLEKRQAAALAQHDCVGALDLYLRTDADFIRLRDAETADNRSKSADTGKAAPDTQAADAKAKQAELAKAQQEAAAKDKKRKAREAAYPQLVKSADPQSIADALLEPDADLDLFRSQPGAHALLDKMMKDIGSKADTPEKKRFVQAAIRGRFAIEGGITGGKDGKGLSSKALPRIYSLLKSIPETHSSDDDKDKRFITAIERRKANDTSVYYNEKKNIVLKAGKTGGKNSNFDQVMLHEIGHAVDLKFSFMNSHGSGTEFGGWQVVSVDDVLRIAGEDLGFYKDFEAVPFKVPRALLESYLRACLSGKDPATLQGQYESVNGTTKVTEADLAIHPAVVHARAGQAAAKGDTDSQRDLFYAARKLVKDAEPKRSLVLAVAKEVSDGQTIPASTKKVIESLQYTGAMPTAQTWATMAKHPAVDFANNARLPPGEHGLWEQGDAGAKRCAVAGRVYQESYKNDWRSYALSARSARITDYQFRHPMEWFAESYAEFFMGKLSTSHAMYKWLKAQKDGVAPKKT
jgi:hypothetical protein